MKNLENNVIRIIIVDDHPIVREGLRVSLAHEGDFEVSGDAGTAAEALTLIEKKLPHLVIVDILLGDDNGIDLISKIRDFNQNIRILACSMYDDRLYAERALRAGAMGYVNKRAGIGRIIEAVRMVTAGEVFLNDRMTQNILSRNVAGGPISPTSTTESLSNRELEIFRLIGLGRTLAQIGGLLNLSPKTIENYSHCIRKHLRLENSQQLAREAVLWVLENG